MTEKRKLVLDFIRGYMKIHGVAPSYRVIAEGIGLRSKANIHRIVHRLVSDGHLELHPRRVGQIKIVDRSVMAIAAL